MKNIVLGLLGCAMVIYTIVSCLSIYSISSRKNEVENCLAMVVRKNLTEYYHGEASDAEVVSAVKQELLSQLFSDSRVTVDIYACDMEKGVLSVGVTEEFYLPNGMWKKIKCTKTAVAG